MGGQLQVADGKGDLEVKLSPVFENLQASAVRDLSGQASQSSNDEVRIEPAFAPSDALNSLRYNLERLDVSWNADYKLNTFTSQVSAIPWDVAGAYGLVAIIGFEQKDWNWGTTSFHFANEGWFGRDTKYLGVDKLGHAYTAYLLSEYFTQRIAHSTEDRAGAALTGAVLGMGIQTYVEILDGFSDNGFSPQDFVADGVGAGFSVLRNTIPGLADKLDFRMEYIPSGNDGSFQPFHDYTGQKYVLALKLSGFERFEDTPLRFVELQGGYYARGFTDAEEARGDQRQREPYVAIGLNLQEVLDGERIRDTTPAIAARAALQYIQVPYTYAASN
jgi:hypothetical protein